MFQAIGNGVICESSLYVNQYGLTGPVSLITIFVGLRAVTDFTSSGIPPEAYAAQLSFSTFSMFIQNTTCWAVTDSPFDHLYGFSVKRHLSVVLRVLRIRRQRTGQVQGGGAAGAEPVQRPVHGLLEIGDVHDAEEGEAHEREDVVRNGAGRQGEGRRSAGLHGMGGGRLVPVRRAGSHKQEHHDPGGGES